MSSGIEGGTGAAVDVDHQADIDFPIRTRFCNMMYIAVQGVYGNFSWG